MAICINWSRSDDTHFRGLCTQKLKLETPPDLAKGMPCEVCVNPTRAASACNSYEIGSPNSLLNHFGLYYTEKPFVGPSLDPALWISTWHPFLKITIPSGGGTLGGEPWSGNCPTLYEGVHILTSQDVCGAWLTDDQDRKIFVTACPASSHDNRMRVESPLITGFSLGQTVTESYVVLKLTWSVFGGSSYDEKSISFRSASRTTSDRNLYWNMFDTYTMTHYRRSGTGSAWTSLGSNVITIEPYYP